MLAEKTRATIAFVAAEQASRGNISTVGAAAPARLRTLAADNQQLTDLDAQLASARSRIDPNNAEAVAGYKALLERRDAAYRQISPAQSAAAAAVGRYNASVGEYNQRCAGRPLL